MDSQVCLVILCMCNNNHSLKTHQESFLLVLSSIAFLVSFKLILLFISIEKQTTESHTGGENMPLGIPERGGFNLALVFL